MSYRFQKRSAVLVLLITLACTATRVTPQPTAPIEQLQFEVQTATPTVGLLLGAPTNTPDPNATATSSPINTSELTSTTTLTDTEAITTTEEVENE